MNRYPKYKSSSIDWIDDIPCHWELKRLKYVALVQPSNVDKKTNEGEIPVLLCNYMDVYKNEFIDETIKFMEASANTNEIEKFKIIKGDILVTKDSETPDDIAKPAYIKNDFENVICGYHLAQIRTNRKRLLGEYLFRLFQENKFKAQFEISANGVTRYGLSVSAFTDAFIALPPIEEQTTIANYLDQKTAQLDTLTANKKKLIELFKEERTAIINKAVSGKGRNWERKKLKYVAKLKSGDGITSDDIRPEGDYPVFGGNGLRGFTNKYTHEGEYILIGRQGALCGNINYAEGKFFASEHAVVVSILDGSELIWLGELLRNMNLNQYSLASAQPGLSVERIQNLIILAPPKSEQILIVQYIQSETQRIDTTISKIEKEIELLQEYREALISEVVTGKVKIITN